MIASDLRYPTLPVGSLDLTCHSATQEMFGFTMDEIKELERRAGGSVAGTADGIETALKDSGLRARRFDDG